MLAALVGYIDVGTGSYLLTAIAGGFATLWFFLRAKIDKLLGRRPTDEPVEPDPAAPQSDASQSDAEQRTAELNQE